MIRNGTLNRYIAQYGDGAPIAPSARRTKVGTTIPTLGVWYHLAVVIRGSLDMDIYVNGKNDCGFYSGTGGPISYNPILGGNSGITDGSTLPSPLGYFHGALDDIRFWSRALSEQEIASLQDVPPGLVNIDTTICPGDTMQLNGGYAVTHSWSDNQSDTLSCTTCPDPLVYPSSTTDYQLITNNGFGCTDTYRRSLSTAAKGAEIPSSRA